MINYEKRLIKFLKANPHNNLSVRDIAAIWKRNYADVHRAAMGLFTTGKLRMIGKTNAIRLSDGIGGA